MKVIVIGCGPAGLAAAHAAVGLGCDVKILAPKLKTPQRGPLLIQRPIPGINRDHPDGTVHQVVIGGSILDYRYRLYGDINIGINGNILQPQYHAWNHRDSYDRLWALYNDLIVDRTVLPSELRVMHRAADLVVSTANAKRLCQHRGDSPHEFQSAYVMTINEAMYPNQPQNTIIFNAGNRYPWVRSSRIFGAQVTEFTTAHRIPGGRLIEKPISTNCNCYPHVLRTGRFGAWKNETWVDTAYWDTYSMLTSIERAEELRGINEEGIPGSQVQFEQTDEGVPADANTV